MYSNLDPSNNGPIKHGTITMDESLNDYPTLTIVSQQPPQELNALGSTYTYNSLVFYLESLSLNKVPISDLEIYEEVTYNYVHVSKKILEFPINTREFIESKYGKDRTKSNTTYIVPISSLITFAASKVPYGAVFSSNYVAEISKNPSLEETITLKGVIDEQRIIYEHVLLFNGGYAYLTKLASKSFIPPNIINNFTVSWGLSEAYRNSILSWNKKEKYSDADENSLTRSKFRKKRKTDYMLYEGDSNPHLPPREINMAPRDLSIMIDNSGLTKQCKITKYKFEQPEVEIEAVFGYAHSALELVGDPSKPNAQADLVSNLLSEDILSSGNAYQEVLSSIASGTYGYPDDADFVNPIVWRLLSVHQKVYIYEPLNIVARPKVKQNGKYVDVQIAPGYSKFTKSFAQVLVAEETTGWEIKRFAQESANDWAKGSIQKWNELTVTNALQASITTGNLLSKEEAIWQLYYAKVGLEQYLFRKIPLYERLDYAIDPYSRYYTDADKIDWEVEMLPRSAVYGTTPQASEDEVAVLYPSPSWSPSLMLNSRSRYKTSVGLSGNPEYKRLSRNYYGSNPITITTGTEEHEYVKYLILPSKTTKTTLKDMYDDQVSTEALLDTIQDQLDSKGTYYTPHNYMDISDYGIKDVAIDQLTPLIVKADLPTAKSQREDRYAELSVLFNASDNSYKSKISTRTYSLNQGRPPSVTVRFPVFDEIEPEDEDTKKNNGYGDTTTYVTSNNWLYNTNINPSVSIGAANNVNEALKGARFLLQMNVLEGNTVSATLNFRPFFAKPICNSITTIPDINGTWLIKRASHSVHYTDGVALLQPISIEGGLLTYPSLISKTVPVVDDEDGAENDSSSDVNIKALLPKRYGVSYEDVPSGFGRWIDDNN